MNTFQEYFNKRFLFEEAPGISAPGGLPGGGPPGGAMGGPPMGMPPPPGGGMGGPPGPPMGGAPPGGAPGGDMSGKKPLIVNSLDVWKTLKSIFGLDEEKPADLPEKQTQLKHLQS